MILQFPEQISQPRVVYGLFKFDESQKREMGFVKRIDRESYFTIGLYYSYGYRIDIKGECRGERTAFYYDFDDIGVVGSCTYKLLPRKTASNRFNMDLYVFIRGGLALRFKNGEERAVRYVPFYVSKKIEDYSAKAIRPLFSLGLRLDLNIGKH